MSSHLVPSKHIPPLSGSYYFSVHATAYQGFLIPATVILMDEEVEYILAGEHFHADHLKSYDVRASRWSTDTGRTYDF